MCNTYSLILNCRNKTVKLILKTGYNFLYLNLCSCLNVVCFCFVAVVVVVIVNAHTKKCIQFFSTEMVNCTTFVGCGKEWYEYFWCM